ncbi:retrovirus-related pol polyprotein from transposon TNT 1-94 [Tanacetum coccineum]
MISTPQLMLVQMHEFGKFTSRDGESLESYYSRFYKMMNELFRNKYEVTNHQVNVQFLFQLQPEWQMFLTLVKQSQESQQAAARNRGKAIVNSPLPIYDHEPDMFTEDDALSKEKEIDKLMALISLSFKKIYKPTNNNLITSSNTSRANQDNTPRINRGIGYDNQRVVNVAGARENIASHKEKTLLYKQEEAGVLLSAEQVDWRDNTDDEPEDHELEEYSVHGRNSRGKHDDDYNVFTNDRQHLEQPESVNDTYPDEQGDNNIIIDSLDMSTNGDQADHDDDDLARERNFLASLIEKLKCEIDDSKNHNKFLKSSNQTLVDKFKNLKKFQAELDRNEKELIAHQESISITSQEKEAQKNFYKTHDDKELEKFIALENKIKVLDDIVYKTGQSVQTMNMLNRIVKRVLLNLSSSRKRILFLNEIDRLSKEYYYADHMNAILGVYTTLDEFTDLQCDYVDQVVKCERFEKELSKSNTTSNSFEALQQHAIDLEIALQQCHEQIKNNKAFKENQSKLIEIILFIIDSGCSKHLTRNIKLLSNFVEKFMGTTKFGNDQIAPILGYGDLVQGNVTIKRVYYVEGLNHNLFSVGSHGIDLYSITLQNTTSPNPICLMAKASSSQAWLWHCRLSHLNFDTINLLSKYDIMAGLPKLKFVKHHLYSFCELGKAKHKSFKTKITPSSKRRLQILHMDLCGPIRVESFNGKKYVLVIVDDYSRYTWTYFMRSKDETPKVLIDFLKLVQRGLYAQVRTDRGTKFLNKTLHAYFAQEGIEHQTSTARTLEQNGVVKRCNHTLAEAARTMLSAPKVPLFFWTEAIATTYFTENCSLVIPRHEKTPYHIINGRKPSAKFFHIFGSLCYIVTDGENLDMMKEKGDACIFVGYSIQSRAYRVYNKRTRVIVETIHVNFDELTLMASDHVNSDPVPQSKTVTTSNDLDLLFSLMFDELLNETTPVVSKSSVVHAADAPNQRQHENTTPSTLTIVATDTPPLNIQTTPVTKSQAPTQALTVIATKNINQAETHEENAQVNKDEFINIFSTPIHEHGETSSRYLRDMVSIDHPLEQVIGNPSQSIRTRRQLETNGEMCMFALTVSQIEPKNIKEAMADSAWIEAMKEELHQFDQFDVSSQEGFIWTQASSKGMIHQSPRGIFINQAKYAQEMLKKHGMTSCDSIGTPSATKPLDADLSGTLVDQTKYHSMVGALMNGYLRKGRKTKPKRQNRTRNGKAWKRQSQDKAQV